MRPRLFVLLCSCLLLGPLPALAARRYMGFVHADLSRVAPEHEVGSVLPARDAPGFRDLPRVDLSAEVPPVGNQGGQGSCMSWAVGYYHRSQLEYRERYWNLADPSHQFSAAFLYNQVNGGADRGSGFDNNMSLVCEQGCASMALSPYNDADCTTWPSESAYVEAIPYRTRDWNWFDFQDTSGLGSIKQLLANGSTCVIAIWCWGNFDQISRYDNMYCSADRIGSNLGGHGVCIVGYDDTLATHDGRGAFRVVNSWGPGWSDDGFFWMSYEAALDTFLSQREVGYLVDTVGYVPSLYGRIRIDHPTRDRVALMFYVGRLAGPLWYKEFRTWRHAGVNQPFPANNMVFDLTEGADHIQNGQADSVYFFAWDCRRDGQGGSIEHMAAQYLPWGNACPSSQTPVLIPDDGALVHAGSMVEPHDLDACAAGILAPLGIVEPESSYVPAVLVRNSGTSPVSFRVRLRIGDWTDSAQVSGLQPAAAREVSFRPWTCPDSGVCVLRCSTELSGDEYHANDTCTAAVVVRYHDAALLEILVPADTVDSGTFVRPQVRVRNNGTQPETFILTFRIPDEGYSRPAQLTVAPDTAGTALFPPWVPHLLGDHAMSCTLAFAPDQNPSNNLLSGLVTVRPDVGVEEARAVAAFSFDVPSPLTAGSDVTARLCLPGTGPVALTLYNAAGRLVAAPVRRLAAAGRQQMDIPSAELSCGAYLLRLDAPGRSATRRVLIVR